MGQTEFSINWPSYSKQKLLYFVSSIQLMKKRQIHTNHHYQESEGLSFWMKVFIFSFVFGLALSCIVPITENTVAIVEIHDHTDEELLELADGEPKFEMSIQPLLASFIAFNKQGNNWSSSSYFSELPAEILTPPPDFLV